MGSKKEEENEEESRRKRVVERWGVNNDWLLYFSLSETSTCCYLQSIHTRILADMHKQPRTSVCDTCHHAITHTHTHTLCTTGSWKTAKVWRSECTPSTHRVWKNVHVRTQKSLGLWAGVSSCAQQCRRLTGWPTTPTSCLLNWLTSRPLNIKY